jgi:hypothetical protein
MDGKPFLVVSQAVDPGLLQVLECDIADQWPDAVVFSLLVEEYRDNCLVLQRID